MFQLISGAFMASIDLLISIIIGIVLTILYSKKRRVKREVKNSAMVNVPIGPFLKVLLSFNLGSFLFGLFIVVIPNIQGTGEFWIVNRGNIGGIFYAILILPAVTYLILIREIKKPQLKLLRKITIYVLIVVFISSVVYNSLAIAGIKPYPLWMARRVSSTTLLVLLSLYAICGLIIEKKRPAPFYFSLATGLAFTMAMLVVNSTYHLNPTFASTLPLNFPSFFGSTVLLFILMTSQLIRKIDYDTDPSDFSAWRSGKLIAAVA